MHNAAADTDADAEGDATDRGTELTDFVSNRLPYAGSSHVPLIMFFINHYIVFSLLQSGVKKKPSRTMMRPRDWTNS